MSTPIEASEEVLSGEAVAIDVQPLGFFLRVLGALIDMALSFGLYVLFLFLRIWMLDAGLIDDAIDRILNVSSMVVCFVVVPVALEVSLRGRSLGKLAVGGRIVRVDGGATGFRHAFIRALLGVLEIYMTFGSVALLTGAFTARSQRLGDLVAGTYSQRVRTPKLVPHEPALPPMLAEWAGVADVARLPDRLARRISQFLRTAPQMMPQARARIADQLVAEALPFVSPRPIAPAEQVLAAITVIRRGRERRALQIADERAERLSGRSIGA
ncbi:RDD family protein [Microbacterium sp. CIAB417]|uniref:RDD family protein n=1 Tax=Microbacterium sp. CIAB417 TaxID=2860287 RepID=UPI001FABF8AC|nr:RDD family protein [Microbacterium sp. CIAB417]